MPCSVSQQEQEHYERKANAETYGQSELTARITETVACELSRLVEKHGIQSELSTMATKWIEIHKAADAERGEG